VGVAVKEPIIRLGVPLVVPDLPVVGAVWSAD